jgi:hypothetical protein
MMKSALNPHDKSIHKDRSCARIWREYLVTMFKYYEASAEVANHGHDEAAYPPDQKEEPRLKKHLAEEEAKVHLQSAAMLHMQYNNHCK